LAKKLGIKENTSMLAVSAPEGYFSLLQPLPGGVKFSKQLTAMTDIVHIFTTRKEELRRFLAKCRGKLKPSGMIWVSWPKKASKVSTDITEDTIREIALPMGFVDTKVCAVDEIWSGLKLVIRKGLR